jgi:hypothetical protein
VTDDESRPGYLFKQSVKTGLRYLLQLLAIAGVVGAIVFVGLMAAERVFSDGVDAEVAEARRVADSVASARRVDSLLLAMADTVAFYRDSIAQRDSTETMLRQRSDGLSTQVTVLRDALSNATTSVDTIRLAGNLIQTQDSLIEACGLRVTNCQAQRRLDSLIIVQERAAKDSVKAELDTLRRVTGTLVDVTSDCKRGEWNLLVATICRPSSAVVFFAGATVGAVGFCLLTDCLSPEASPPPVVIYTPQDPGRPDPPSPNPKEP